VGSGSLMSTNSVSGNIVVENISFPTITTNGNRRSFFYSLSDSSTQDTTIKK
jgi:hypothetical protein